MELQRLLPDVAGQLSPKWGGAKCEFDTLLSALSGQPFRRDVVRTLDAWRFGLLVPIFVRGLPYFPITLDPGSGIRQSPRLLLLPSTRF